MKIIFEDLFYSCFFVDILLNLLRFCSTKVRPATVTFVLYLSTLTPHCFISPLNNVFPLFLRPTPSPTTLHPDLPYLIHYLIIFHIVIIPLELHFCLSIKNKFKTYRLKHLLKIRHCYQGFFIRFYSIPRFSVPLGLLINDPY